MGIILFFLWIVLNGRISWDWAFLEIVLTGIVLSVILQIFVTKFTRWSRTFDLFFVRYFYLFVAYGLMLLWEIVVSNFKVISLIMKRHETPKPVIVCVDVPLKNEMLRTIFANSVTITPGTITISCTENHFVIHCLREEFAEGIDESKLVKMLVKMEAKLNERK